MDGTLNNAKVNWENETMANHFKLDDKIFYKSDKIKFKIIRTRLILPSGQIMVLGSVLSIYRVVHD